MILSLSESSGQEFYMRQRTEITWEIEETVLVRRGVTVAEAFCPKCEADVEMMPPDVVVWMTGSDEREIFRLIEMGEVYFIKPDRVLACVGCCYRCFDAGQDDKQRQRKRLLINGKNVLHEKERQGHEE
jgi:hypothetical protein